MIRGIEKDANTEVEELIETPREEETLESTFLEEEVIASPVIESEAECQADFVPPEEEKQSTEVRRVVSRQSDPVISKRQVIRKHIQVSMVTKLRENEVESSEEYSSSSEEEGGGVEEETAFEPVKRAKSSVLRTAVRQVSDDASKRQVIRKRERETEELIEDDTAGSGVAGTIQVTENVRSELPISPDANSTLEEFLGHSETGGDEEEMVEEDPGMQLTRVVQRTNEEPVSSRQVIRSVVRESYLTTATVQRESQESEDEYFQSATSSDNDDDREIDDTAEEENGSELNMSRIAIRGEPNGVTRRQVYRTIEVEIHDFKEHRVEGSDLEEEAVVEDDVIPKPVITSEVEEQPDYTGRYFEEEPDATWDEEPSMKRTIVRQPDDVVTRRQVIRSEVIETHSNILHLTPEDEEDFTAELEKANSDPREVEVNGMGDSSIEEIDEVGIINEDLPKKFDFLRTALRQGEKEPVTRRQVYRSKVEEITTIDEEIKNQMNAEKEAIDAEDGNGEYHIKWVCLSGKSAPPQGASL